MGGRDVCPADVGEGDKKETTSIDQIGLNSIARPRGESRRLTSVKPTKHTTSIQVVAAVRLLLLAPEPTSAVNIITYPLIESP